MDGCTPDRLRLRCWVHTHPDHEAYMSALDLIQLFWLRKNSKGAYDDTFGIVLSPRRSGVKALCVHLTDQGFQVMERYLQIAGRESFKDYASARIENSSQEFYCQIPFQITDVPASVVDYRTTQEVVGQLSAAIDDKQTREWN